MAIDDVERRIVAADERYGPFASTHEALGVALEEWDEFKAAVHDNNLEQVRHECFDLAAVLIRLARDISISQKIKLRSTK